MKEPEHEDYDDDEYKFYPENGEYSKSFNIDWAAWQEWLEEAIKDITQENDNTWVINKKQKFPVSDSTPVGTSKDYYFMYLGSNHYQESISVSYTHLTLPTTPYV